MTSRERLLLTLGGHLLDRVPVAPFVQEEYLAFDYPHKAMVDRVDIVRRTLETGLGL